MDEEIKQHDSTDPNWINELPVEEFDIFYDSPEFEGYEWEDKFAY